MHFAELAAAGPVAARVETQTLSETQTTRNVIAETPGGRADNVVFAGAHLDSVIEGPGINDNGTGSAALLELGLKLGDEPPKNKVRLAFWGGEEGNLLGHQRCRREGRGGQGRRGEGQGSPRSGGAGRGGPDGARVARAA